MQAVLEVTTGPHTGRRIPLSPGVPLRIGRTSKSDYVVAEDTFLSGAHFYVEWSGDGCVVRDLNSSNGTFLNGTRTSEAALREGDIITAGQSSFTFHMEAAEGEPGLDETRPMPTSSLFGASAGLNRTEPLPPSAPPLPPWAPPPYGSQPLEPAAMPAGAPPLPGGAPSPPPAPRLPTSLTPEPPAGPELTPTQRAMVDVLRGLADPIYAVVDRSAASSLIDAVRASSGAVETVSDAGASMIVVNAESPIAAQFAAEDWGRGSAIFITSRQPAAIVRNHLRRFQTLLSSDGVEFQFRFYNPALMRAFLTTLNGEEAKALFGPITAMLMEGATPEELIVFMPGSGGTLKKVMPLGSGSAAQA